MEPYTARIHNLTVVARLQPDGRKSLRVIGTGKDPKRGESFKGLTITRELAAKGHGTAYFDRVFWMLKSA